ncbi:hypothetical protein B5807_09595 [Epicoccum nigrum]|uniref:Uncharacterized protein n=1 Tax=Epicoccum nigrum TaxID=105696 RepID=A0A1Y2LPN3_EPING|nr:hypothetical protein B5807_09595 [Epicoccum nigrum]
MSSAAAPLEEPLLAELTVTVVPMSKQLQATIMQRGVSRYRQSFSKYMSSTSASSLLHLRRSIFSTRVPSVLSIVQFLPCCCTSKDSGCMDGVDPRLWYPMLDQNPNQYISIPFLQQHEVKDSPRSVLLTDSMEAFSNKLCAANRAACASSFRPASRNFRLAARPCYVAIRRTGPP